ncbi:MAG: hypothetical protein Q8920_04265 [Bacillota bacterium]|nr:hypothetical protein [Bacillota bacterium]
MNKPKTSGIVIAVVGVAIIFLRIQISALLLGVYTYEIQRGKYFESNVPTIVVIVGFLIAAIGLVSAFSKVESHNYPR